MSHEVVEVSVAFTAIGTVLLALAILLGQRWRPLPNPAEGAAAAHGTRHDVQMTSTTDTTPEPLHDLVIRDVAVLDCTGAEPSGRHDVVVRDGTIASIHRHAEGATIRGAREIDGAGTTLMPASPTPTSTSLIGRKGDHGDEPPIDHPPGRDVHDGRSTRASRRSATRGPWPAWARPSRRAPSAAADPAPRARSCPRPAATATTVPPTMRSTTQAVPADRDPRIVDGRRGPSGVTRQLRRGATQIRCWRRADVSPTDPFDSVQFSAGEIAAAVEVAAGWHTYVLAHCHTSPAIDVAIANGVRSIEHGTMLEEATARRMKELGVYMVPTLQTIDLLVAHPEYYSLPPEKVARLNEVKADAAKSVKLADEIGVRVASGSDVVGPWQGRRGEELAIKAGLLGAHKAILSATSVNAALFRMEDRIGTVEAGKDADLILVGGEPLDRIELLSDPACVSLVVQQGRVVKDAEGRAAA